ncbi:MAG: hypothetical protein Q7U30_14785, partial [Methylicorpusculum sp.]|nr:hypothetical protein [Methylicorpusculum sp.]
LKIQLIVWENEVLIFNRLTQDTHLLNKPADWILDKLNNNTLSVDELTKTAISQNIIPNDQDSFLYINNFLTCLKEINLIELTSNRYEDNSLA